MRKKYNKESWINSRVEIRGSKLNNKGLFAKAPIRKDEVVMIWGGELFTNEDIREGKYRKGSSVEIDEGIYLAGKPDEPPGLDDFLNHSCNPNSWLKDEVTLIAMRDIKRDEELTADYGTWISRPDWKMECKCGSEVCRKIITGEDWKLRKLQERYNNHFSPYLNERIKKVVCVGRQEI